MGRPHVASFPAGGARLARKPRQQACYCYDGGLWGEMHDMSGEQRRERFYMLNMDTHGGTQTCTHTTHIHIHPHVGALGRRPTNRQPPILRCAH